MRCWLSAVLSVVLLMTVLSLPMSVSEEASSDLVSGDFQYVLTGDNSTVRITGYVGDGGDVTIPDRIEGLPVTSIEAMAFSENDNIDSMTIPVNVTSIGGGAFELCSNLVAINVDPGNEEFASSDGVLFDKDLSYLIKYPQAKPGDYVIPSSVNTIAYQAFSYSSALTSLVIPDSVTSISSNAFQYCSELISVSIGSGVIIIPYMAFTGCSALPSLTLPGTVGSVGMMAFFSCTNLSEVVFEEGVTSFEYGAFQYCTSITNLTFPDSAITIGPSSFARLFALTNLSLGNGMTTIGDSAFSGCSSLTNVTIPASVSSIGVRVFSSCSSLTEIEVEGANTHYASVDGVLYTEDLTTMLQMPPGRGGDLVIPDHVTTLMEGSVTSNPGLTSVYVPENVTDIGDFVFSYCSSLTAITVDDNNTDYASLDGVLYDKNLTKLIQFPEGKNGAFVVPNSVVTIGAWSFVDCDGLTSVTIPEGVTLIDEGAFSECDGLITLDVPSSVIYIGEWVVDESFSLGAINVAEGNAQYASREGVLFNENLTILLKFPFTKAGEYIVPESVQTIAAYAFDECDSLTRIVFQSNLTSIEGYAFNGGVDLNQMVFRGDAPDCDYNWINRFSPNLIIYYHPDATGFTSPTWYDVRTLSLAVPTAPQLTSAEGGDGQVTLTWSIIANDALDGFKVFYGTSSPDIQFGTVTTANTIVVTGLTNGTSYQFVVKAVNAMGDSGPSNVMSATPGSQGEEGGKDVLPYVLVGGVAVAAVIGGLWYLRRKRK